MRAEAERKVFHSKYNLGRHLLLNQALVQHAKSPLQLRWPTKLNDHYIKSHQLCDKFRQIPNSLQDVEAVASKVRIMPLTLP